MNNQELKRKKIPIVSYPVAMMLLWLDTKFNTVGKPLNKIKTKE